MARKPTEPALFNDEPDTSDIPEAGEEFFKKAKLKKGAVAVVQHHSLADTISRIASDKNLDTDKMRFLVQMQAEYEFNEAMADMDAELPVVNRDGKIQIAGGKPLRFASFENLNRQVKPILRKHRFRMSFQPNVGPKGEGLVVDCYLKRGFYSEHCQVPVSTSPASKAMNAQQATGAAIAYAKRYGMIALLNIETFAQDDRDVDASDNTPEKQATEAQIKKMQAAVAKHEVPEELIKQHYPDYPNLSASDVTRFLSSCENYGARNK